MIYYSKHHSQVKLSEAVNGSSTKVKSIKNPIGKGNLARIESVRGWGCDKVIPETIFGKEHKIYIHVYGDSANATGLNAKQQEAADFYNKNKVKMYREMNDQLFKYANSFLGAHEQPFQLEEQLNMLFIPDGIGLDRNGMMTMELENVFDPEHGIFVHMYPGKMYCTSDPILSPYAEAASKTESSDKVKSIKNPFGSGTLKNYEHGQWSVKSEENIISKKYSVKLSVTDYKQKGISDAQTKACDYFVKNKSKIYKELEDALYKYANDESDDGSSGRFYSEKQLQSLFEPYAINVESNATITMWMNNTFEHEHGLCAKLYPGKVKVYVEA